MTKYPHSLSPVSTPSDRTTLLGLSPARCLPHECIQKPERPFTGTRLSDLTPCSKPAERRPLRPRVLGGVKRGARGVDSHQGKTDGRLLQRGGAEIMLSKLIRGWGGSVSVTTCGMEARQWEELPWARKAGRAPHGGQGRCPGPRPPPHVFPTGAGGVGGGRAGGRWRLPGRR